MSRDTPRAWWLVVITAAAIAGYGFAYVVLGERMFNGPLADGFRARPWAIFTHALFSAIALAIGPFQFRRGLLVRRRALHRRLGTIYVVCAAAGGGVSGVYMATFSYGGWPTHVGFGALALATLLSTVLAYRAVRRRRFVEHREWMIRSYALIFAAVTLRIELPILVAMFGGFHTAYLVVAWLCWIPNLIWAEWYVHSTRGARSGVGELVHAISTA